MLLLTSSSTQPTSGHGAQINWLAQNASLIRRKLSGNAGQCAFGLSVFLLTGTESQAVYFIDQEHERHGTLLVYEMFCWFSFIGYKYFWEKLAPYVGTIQVAFIIAFLKCPGSCTGRDYRIMGRGVHLEYIRVLERSKWGSLCHMSYWNTMPRDGSA